ncbi:hypothetical protein HYQ45_006541 [Verticillium longisporum]|uniref:Delta(24)-sterol reductase n=1 Tax=Verticillium longisporum TaxID=100787 RepID=A0A8I2ZR87_VERLO|nr:hypothetical protein HYQ45_006541 [Verticillium longisporum]
MSTPPAPQPSETETSSSLTVRQQAKLLLEILPKVPLIVQTALLHILHLSESAKHLDLRGELIVAVLRSFLQTNKPRTISSTQRLVNRDPGVKGRIWVANYAAPVPPETGVRDALTAAIEALQHHSTASSAKAPLRLPKIVAVEAEWTGYRAAAAKDATLPVMSERERYDEMQKEVQTPLTVLYFHGGAYYVGDPCAYRAVTKKLAKLTGGRCYSVRYRLAPQDPFPAALLDALTSYLTLLYPPPDAYHEAVEAQNIVFSGDSAGGNLSLALLQTLLEPRRQKRTIAWFGEEREVPLPAGVAACSPWMDLTQSSPSWEANGAFDYLPTPRRHRAISIPPCEAWPASPPRTSMYADDALLAHPLATLLMARDWTGAPPVYVCTGWELLADEDKYIAKHLRSQGVPVVFEEYEGMPHCFVLLMPGMPNAQRCFEGWTGFMKAVVGTFGGIESRAVSVKAKTLEETELSFESLSEVTEEAMRSRVLKSIADNVPAPPEASAKLIASSVRAFFDRKEPYRIFHGSTNSTRPFRRDRFVDISALNNVLEVNEARRIALVEPNVPMDRLVENTLRHGLIPPVVMEFPGITAGGGYAGTAGESSSFKHGFFDDTINEVEMVLANGDVVKASPTERADLFRGAAGAVGTLGITTLIELQLIEAKKYVKTTYHRTRTVAEAVELTFSGAWDPWYYLHVEERTKAAGTTDVSAPAVDFIPLAEYLFRYDRGGFWVGAAAFDYFRPVPFNRFFRWFLDDFLHTRMLYRALHGSGESARFMVQDLALPYENAEKFIDYTTEHTGIWPLWLCPLQQTPAPTFHPHTDRPAPAAASAAPAAPGAASPRPKGRPMLNIGLWGFGAKEPAAFVAQNRALEDKLHALGGMKWLYAHLYQSRDDFWRTYDAAWYDALRAKYGADTLPTVYDKVKVDVNARAEELKQWRQRLKATWPLAGLWGIWKSIQSKDYKLHRNAEWKFNKERDA